LNVAAIFDGLGVTALSVANALLPLLAFLVLFQVLFLKLPKSYVFNLLKGTLLSAVGLLFFLQGVQIGFLPYGQAIGESIGSFPYKWVAIPFGLILGFLTTWSEPAVRILTHQVENASAGSVRSSFVLYSVCAGVAVFVAVGMARIIYSIPLLYILVPGYALAVILLWFTPKEFMSVAFDAGGVATGPMANTFLLGLGLGLASVVEGQDTIVYGLGLVALIALAPIISVMALGLMIRTRIR